jgi:hypothetical protein
LGGNERIYGQKRVEVEGRSNAADARFGSVTFLMHVCRLIEYQSSLSNGNSASLFRCFRDGFLRPTCQNPLPCLSTPALALSKPPRKCGQCKDASWCASVSVISALGLERSHLEEKASKDLCRYWRYIESGPQGSFDLLTRWLFLQHLLFAHEFVHQSLRLRSAYIGEASIELPLHDHANCTFFVLHRFPLSPIAIILILCP